MIKRVFLVTLFLLFTLGSAYGQEDISFKGTSKSSSGKPFTFTGKLYKPPGNYSFPAVVLLHGCNGILEYHHSWAEKITSWGYVVLVLDSLGPRGLKSVCENPHDLAESLRVRDAFDAKAYLSELPFVNRNRIGIVGFSHGGGTILCALSRINLKNFSDYFNKGVPPSELSDLYKQKGPFQVAVAFYPFCGGELFDSESPLLILAGDKDTWTPAGNCKSNMPGGKTKHEIVLKIYEGATHAFDRDVPERVVLTHKIRHDPQATADATHRVYEFLKKYLFD